MRIFVLGCVALACLVAAGCSSTPQPSHDTVQTPDSRSLTHITETNKLRLGMHESEVFQILGAPSRRESGFSQGYRLWYELYDPRNGSVPSNYLISTDRNGYVTFISSGGAPQSSQCPCPCP